jgi:hypothetical protein
MTSNEKVMNIKVINLFKIYNLYFGHIFIHESDNNIVHKIYIFLIWFHETIRKYVKYMNNVNITFSDEKMTKITFVDLDEIYNCVVYNFFI